MIVHNIIDISPLYHRFAYRMRNNGSDIPIMYLVLKEVERMREGVESRGADVITSACFDSHRSFRKELIKSDDAEAYKSGRKSILTEEDFKDMETMKEIMRNTGINVFCKEGCEADDLMAKVGDSYKDDFDLTVMYTPDKDMMINVKESIGMRKLSPNFGWISISVSNFVEEASAGFKVNMPYNAIGLYLSTVGDSADKIPGIYKFGARAFEKLVNQLGDTIDWSKMTDYEYVKDVIITSNERGYISDEQFKQAVESYNMVRAIEIDNNDRSLAEVIDGGNGIKKIVTGMSIPTVLSVSTSEKRKEVYSNAGMKSIAR